jgi:hypothetical protein
VPPRAVRRRQRPAAAGMAPQGSPGARGAQRRAWGSDDRCPCGWPWARPGGTGRRRRTTRPRSSAPSWRCVWRRRPPRIAAPRRRWPCSGATGTASAGTCELRPSASPALVTPSSGWTLPLLVSHRRVAHTVDVARSTIHGARHRPRPVGRARLMHPDNCGYECCFVDECGMYRSFMMREDMVTIRYTPVWLSSEPPLTARLGRSSAVRCGTTQSRSVMPAGRSPTTRPCAEAVQPGSRRGSRVPLSCHRAPEAAANPGQ